MMKSCMTIAAAAAVLASAGPASAEPGREIFSVEFRYDSTDTAFENYSVFLRQAKRACITPGVKQLSAIEQEKACIAGLMDQLIDRMGRADLAAVHLERSGRHIEAPRELAAR